MVAAIEHCVFCFDILVAHFEGREHLEPEFENAQYLHQGQPRLRGCIGNFDALPLHSGLKEYAITSDNVINDLFASAMATLGYLPMDHAIHDKRFSPITARELSHLTCGVSLLTNFEDAEDYLDWEIGVHGIWIEFVDDYNRRRTATYLPEVAEEQGWTKEETIDSLLRKSGYNGRITDKIRSRVVLTRYQSAKYVITYEEYLEHVSRKT
ncbi:9983_t:CDS:2 [Cetraspora pellucida]|uniref:9983_t:CDS:1 n=1 Tax=Cetraspora pellucida TaxID=1433469 RepID=A0ACA9KW83_9GLOM|nr:9983_t:CDS:2 [Cetraspora pellucida]